MNNYYTNNPICPFCFEPALNNQELIFLNEDKIQCSNCGNIFYKNISVMYNNIPVKFPLFTKIKLNSIEESYINWILDDVKGKYLITWPWDEVKFIPILLSEYFFQYPENKVVVFCHSNYLTIDKLNDLHYPTIINSLYKLDKIKNDSQYLLNTDDVFSKNIHEFCEIFINTFDKYSVENFKNIISNLDGFSLIYEDINDYDGLIFDLGCVKNSDCIKKRFLNNFKKIFGHNSIKFINGFDKIDENENGIFELNFFKSYEYNKNLIINENIQNSFEKCFFNKYDLLPSLYDIDTCYITSKDEMTIKTQFNQLFFIDESQLSEEVLDLIKDIRPNLIISKDIDGLFGKDRFTSSGRKLFFNLLDFGELFLMFSTNLNYRALYKIGSRNYFLKKQEVIPHTWDYKIVMDKIKRIEENSLSLCSSNFENKLGKNSKLNIEILECESLGKIESKFYLLDEIFYKNSLVKRTFEDLMKSPLYIKGTYRDLKVLNRNLNFEYLLNIAYNHDEEKWKILIDVLDDLYGFKSGLYKNPIMDIIIDFIKDFSEDFIIVVHKNDIRGTNAILNEILGENNIIVSNWSNLNKVIEETSIKNVIATLFPTLNYDLYSSKLHKIILISSPNNIPQFIKNKTRRFTEGGIKPVYLLSDDEPAPFLLKNSLENIIVQEDIMEFNNEINKTFENEYIPQDEKSVSPTEIYQNIIKDEKGLLVLNSDDEGMFLRINDEIYVLCNDDKIRPIKLKKSNFKKLIGSKILVHNSKYQSSNIIFLKFVIEYGNDIELYKGRYKWDNFKELINNMFEWVDLLNKIVNNSLKHYSDKEKIKENVADSLKELDIKAKDVNYIKNFWLAEPIPLLTNQGEIFIYRAERPFNRDNLRLIYEWISKNNDESNVSGLDAYRAHAAANRLKQIRREFFNIVHNSESNKKLKNLHSKFNKYLMNETANFNEFLIKEFHEIKLKKDVSSYNIIPDYEDYID